MILQLFICHERPNTLLEPNQLLDLLLRKLVLPSLLLHPRLQIRYLLHHLLCLYVGQRVLCCGLEVVPLLSERGPFGECVGVMNGVNAATSCTNIFSGRLAFLLADN